MLTRVRLEADGCSATEVEAILHAAADVLDEALNLQAIAGEQIIQREMGEPMGRTAFTGRLVLHPNVADDAGQVAAIRDRGVPLTTFAATPPPRDSGKPGVY